MNKFKMAAVLAAALMASAGAQASTLTYTDTFGLATTNWTHALAGVSQFNSGLGTLNSAAFKLSGDIVQSLKAENTGAVADTLTPVAGANLLFRKGTSTLQTLALSNTGAAFNATAFDGTSDFGGTSGIDFGSLAAAGALNFTLTGASLADLIGSGTLDAFNVRAVGAGSIGSDNGNLDSSISTQARYSLEVTYDYTAAVTPPPAVPEPASLALVGLALAGVAASRRRKA